MSAAESPASVLSQEVFEELAKVGFRMEEALRLEFISGKIWERPVPDGDHGRMIVWLSQICAKSLQGSWLFQDQGLRIGAYRKGNVIPDGVLADVDNFVGQGDWASAEGVLMVVEVTSFDSDTDSRDRKDKPRAYAETGIPLFLLIDRDTCEVKVHSVPDGERYESVVTVPFGKTVTLPDPVGIELDTEPLKDWVR